MTILYCLFGCNRVWIAWISNKNIRFGEKVIEKWTFSGFSMDLKIGNFRDFWPFLRGRFEPVGPHFWCDFISLTNVTRRDLFIAAIKSHRKCGSTGSKSHFLKTCRFQRFGGPFLSLYFPIPLVNDQSQTKNRPYLDNFFTKPPTFFTYSYISHPNSPKNYKKHTTW